MESTFGDDPRDDLTRPRPIDRPVRGVLFDLGGTLFGYGARDRMGAANDTAIARLGFDPADPAVKAARREAADQVSREYAERRSFLHTDLFRDRLALTATLLGVEASPELLDRFTEENIANILEHMPPRDDAVETLRALRDRGLYCAVVSNADDAWLEPAIRRHGLDILLDHWTSSEEADSCKPDVGIFRYALAKARLEASEVLFVGDSPEHDIAGAHRAGMRSVLITDNSGPAPLSAGLEAIATPDATIRTLTELVAIVDGSGRGPSAQDVG